MKKEHLALEELYDYAADHEADTDQRIIMAIKLLEGDPNAYEVARRTQIRKSA